VKIEKYYGLIFLFYLLVALLRGPSGIFYSYFLLFLIGFFSGLFVPITGIRKPENIKKFSFQLNLTHKLIKFGFYMGLIGVLFALNPEAGLIFGIFLSLGCGIQVALKISFKRFLHLDLGEVFEMVQKERKPMKLPYSKFVGYIFLIGSIANLLWFSFFRIGVLKIGGWNIEKMSTNTANSIFLIGAISSIFVVYLGICILREEAQ